jgi:hypothetical protein
LRWRMFRTLPDQRSTMALQPVPGVSESRLSNAL